MGISGLGKPLRSDLDPLQTHATLQLSDVNDHIRFATEGKEGWGVSLLTLHRIALAYPYFSHLPCFDFFTVASRKPYLSISFGSLFYEQRTHPTTQATAMKPFL